MKKFVALLLAVLLVMVNIAALAAPSSKDSDKYTVSEEVGIPKAYTVNGADSATADDIFPAETLSFTVTPPAAVEGKTFPTITVGTEGELTITSQKDSLLAIHIPSVTDFDYEELGAGMYTYTIKENAPASGTETQGVVYDTTTEFTLDLYVYYEKAEGATTPTITRKAVIYSGSTPSEGTKQTEFNNTYNLGSLTVGKTTQGNLVDTSDTTTKYPITVTLSSTLPVRSAIKAAVLSGTASVTTNATIAGTGWTGDKTITLAVANGAQVKITDIPYGVTYTVIEDGTTTGGDTDAITDGIEHITTAQQLAKVNDPDAFTVTGQVDTAKTIGADNKNPVETIVNEKNITIPTGITLETLPYVLIMAIAMVGAVALFARKREEN